MRPCHHRLSAEERDRWAGHLCGLCLTLRDRVGHDARLATSYDGLLLSVLAEDLDPGVVGHRRAGPCPLRGMRTAQVASSSAAAVQLAASVSLLLAAAKMADQAGHAVRRAFDGAGPIRAGLLGCRLAPCTSCAEIPTLGPGQGRRWRGRCASCCDGCDGCDC